MRTPVINWCKLVLELSDSTVLLLKNDMIDRHLSYSTIPVYLVPRGNRLINSGKRTEWSPIRSVIIRVITKSRESNLLIMSMITDRHRTTRSPLNQLIINITIFKKK